MSGRGFDKILYIRLYTVSRQIVDPGPGVCFRASAGSIVCAVCQDNRNGVPEALLAYWLQIQKVWRRLFADRFHFITSQFNKAYMDLHTEASLFLSIQ